MLLPLLVPVILQLIQYDNVIAAADQSFIYIGAVAPRINSSGCFYREGIEDLAAILMAIQEINPRTDLLPNVTLRVSVQSDSYDVAEAFAYADYLANKAFGGAGVRAVVGPFYETSAAVTAQYVSSSSVNLPEISYKASMPDLGNNLIYPNIFRTSSSATLESVTISNLISYYGWKSVILLYSADSYGTYLSNEFVVNFNGTILNKYSLWPGLTDYRQYLRAAEGTPGILTIFVIMMSASADAGVLIYQGYEVGLFKEGVQIIGSATLASSKVWLSLKSSVNISRIMKGVLAISPSTDRVGNPVYEGFVKKWRLQKSTIGVNGCDLALDDDGGYLYQDRLSPSQPYICTGLNFSAYSKSGIEIHDSALDAYDAVYALAYALNTIHLTGSTTYTAANILNALLYNTSFLGASGYLNFKTVGIGSETYGVGDRMRGITYSVLNFNPDYYQVGDESNNGLSSAYRVLFQFSDGLKVPCDPKVTVNCATTIVFNTADNTPPIDFKIIIEVQLNETVRTVTRVFCGLCFLFVLFCAFTVSLFHDHKLIKAAQPGMLGVVLLGILLGIVKIIVATLDVTDGVCIAGVWLGHLSYVLVFGTLILKTWRVHKVVNSGMKKVRITQEMLNLMMATLLFAFCCLLVVHTVVANPHRGHEDREGNTEISRLIKCTVDEPGLSDLLFAVEGAMLLYAAKLCWASKNVPQAVNDSSYVAVGKQLPLHTSYSYQCLDDSSQSHQARSIRLLTFLSLCTYVCSSSHLRLRLRLRRYLPHRVPVHRPHPTEPDDRHDLRVHRRLCGLHLHTVRP